MYGGLTKKGLNNLEEKIDEQLNGRDPKASFLEKSLKDLIKRYSYEVEY